MPATMTKKRPRKASGVPKSPKSPTDRHKNPAIGYRPNAATRAILEDLAGREKRGVSNLVDVLVEEALRSRGLLPPQGN